ncbi:MAG: multiphosphoryl transfer protein [Solirubrobacteraceae bacterium]|nr:multiphosphoryl transfer protein [Solirubrobacteraceae bacterium]
MSVGLVIVSHSAKLAEGVVELAREMGGEDVTIEAAGGMADPPGAIGTDAMVVMEAIVRASSPDGVLVLMDLGSAVMSAEMAVEMVGDDVRTMLVADAPLVEGAVAAAATARGGLGLDDVATAAREALRAASGGGEDALELRLVVPNRLGLHLRPAGKIVAIAARADVDIANATTGAGPVSARSLIALSELARQGEEIVVRARGPEAQAVLDELRALAEDNFGDAADAGGEEPAAAPSVPSAPEPAASVAPGEPLRGLRVAPGIAIGPAQRLRAPEPVVSDAPAGAPADEWRALEAARRAAGADVRAARAAVVAGAGEAEAAIFDAHLLLLDDEGLLDPARRAIENEGRNAGQAWDAAVRAAAGTYGDSADAYLRERAADVLDVGRRVLAHLAGSGAAAPTLDRPGVLVAEDLTPGQTATLDRDLVRGIATARGSATSHAAILARAFGIPAVVGLGAALLETADGTELLLDGDAGTVIADPDPAVRAEAERRREEAGRVAAERRARAAEPAHTRDGRRIEVAANLGAVDEAAAAVAEGAEGVGLLRTEFLFLGREDAPDEDEQVAALSEVARVLDGRPLVIRTLDVGADKPLPFLAQDPEANPFLGRRGIRLALARPDIMRTQLRAILRVAADHDNVKVMFPMVAALSELRAARAMLDDERAALGLDPPLEVGIMVEVPAVAVAAERFAREADFFSIGTNDLAQYTVAAERGNEHVADLATGPVPAVLALVDAVVRGAQAHGRWVGVCGELAGDPLAAALLVGLGVTELSMAPPRIPDVKEALRGLDAGEAAAVARAAIEADDAEAVRALATELPGSAIATIGPS